ncbi:MarR family transcriptional regulator, partial [Candidatus Woesearchaeota archaeon]|nr:MarR family transcriptional regulator [Candidatus Woesearchaeota archaeon]
KKKFFFKSAEAVQSVELVFEPLIKAKIKAVEKKFMRKEIAEYDAVFNGKTGDIMLFSGSKFKQLPGFSFIIELTEAQIQAMKALAGKKEIATGDLALKLKLTSSAVNKTLNELLKKKLVSYNRKKSTYFWFSLAKISVPDSVKKISCAKLELTDKAEKAKPAKLNVSLKDLSRAVRSWFENAELAESETIYYPVYEARLAGEAKARKIFISAVTGDLL